VNGKDKLIQPLAIAIELNLPVFVIFDADGDTRREDHRTKHEKDNCALMSLLEIEQDPFPTSHVSGANYAIWPENLTRAVKNDFSDDYATFTEPVRVKYAQEGGLEKNALFIADWLSGAHDHGADSPTLVALCKNIIEYAKNLE
jgi:hypothetical protein